MLQLYCNVCHHKLDQAAKPFISILNMIMVIINTLSSGGFHPIFLRCSLCRRSSRDTVLALTRVVCLSGYEPSGTDSADRNIDILDAALGVLCDSEEH